MADLPDPNSLFAEWRQGNRAALDALFPLVYQELRRRAHRYLEQEREDHTLTTTALVHETYLKLLDIERVSWNDRAHFLALAATAMRRVLVDYARQHGAAKRGGGKSAEPMPQESGGRLPEPLSLSAQRADQILELDGALEKLAGTDERMSRVVVLRFFGGLTIEETAEALSLAPSTVKLAWQDAKTWLYRELAEA